MQALLKRRSRQAAPQKASPEALLYQPVERPRELATQLLKKLEFKVLRRLDGFLFGDYSGLFYGPSLDLAEVREYQPGDEVRRIDWNVTARTGKVHIRQYREEREIIAWLIIDLSPSMNFGTRKMLKRDGALEFAGVVSSLLTRQGNKIGAMGFTEASTSLTPLGSGKRQAFAILQNLLSLAPPNRGGAEGGGVLIQDLNAALSYVNRTFKRRALVFVISDFISSSATTVDEDPAWSKELQRLAFKHDVIAVRISDPAEHTLPDVGDLRLRDPETAQEVWIDTSDPRVRKTHAKLVAARDEQLRHSMNKAHVDLLELSTDRDIVDPILKFTLKRRGRR